MENGERNEVLPVEGLRRKPNGVLSTFQCTTFVVEDGRCFGGAGKMNLRIAVDNRRAKEKYRSSLIIHPSRSSVDY